MDLPFAIDDLYSAGWWPADADPCLRAPDGRWYPHPDHAQSLFSRAHAQLAIAPLPHATAWRATWTAPRGRHGSVIADDPAAASVLAYAAMLRSIAPAPFRAG